MYSIKITAQFCGDITYYKNKIQQSLTFQCVVLPLQFSCKNASTSGTMKNKINMNNKEITKQQKSC